MFTKEYSNIWKITESFCQKLIWIELFIYKNFLVVPEKYKKKSSETHSNDLIIISIYFGIFSKYIF